MFCSVITISQDGDDTDDPPHDEYADSPAAKLTLSGSDLNEPLDWANEVALTANAVTDTGPDEEPAARLGREIEDVARPRAASEADTGRETTLWPPELVTWEQVDRNDALTDCTAG